MSKMLSSSDKNKRHSRERNYINGKVWRLKEHSVLRNSKTLGDARKGGGGEKNPEK